jgi:hypothetical protein
LARPIDKVKELLNLTMTWKFYCVFNFYK